MEESDSNHLDPTEMWKEDGASVAGPVSFSARSANTTRFSIRNRTRNTFRSSTFAATAEDDRPSQTEESSDNRTQQQSALSDSSEDVAPKRGSGTKKAVSDSSSEDLAPKKTVETRPSPADEADEPTATKGVTSKASLDENADDDAYWEEVDNAEPGYDPDECKGADDDQLAVHEKGRGLNWAIVRMTWPPMPVPPFQWTNSQGDINILWNIFALPLLLFPIIAAFATAVHSKTKLIDDYSKRAWLDPNATLMSRCHVDPELRSLDAANRGMDWTGWKDAAGRAFGRDYRHCRAPGDPGEFGISNLVLQRAIRGIFQPGAPLRVPRGNFPPDLPCNRDACLDRRSWENLVFYEASIEEQRELRAKERREAEPPLITDDPGYSSPAKNESKPPDHHTRYRLEREEEFVSYTAKPSILREMETVKLRKNHFFPTPNDADTAQSCEVILASLFSDESAMSQRKLTTFTLDAGEKEHPSCCLAGLSISDEEKKKGVKEKKMWLKVMVKPGYRMKDEEFASKRPLAFNGTFVYLQPCPAKKVETK